MLSFDTIMVVERVKVNNSQALGGITHSLRVIAQKFIGQNSKTSIGYPKELISLSNTTGETLQHLSNFIDPTLQEALGNQQNNLEKQSQQKIKNFSSKVIDFIKSLKNQDSTWLNKVNNVLSKISNFSFKTNKTAKTKQKTEKIIVPETIETLEQNALRQLEQDIENSKDKLRLQQRLKAIKMLAQGESLEEASEEIGFPQKLLKIDYHAYQEKGLNGLIDSMQSHPHKHQSQYLKDISLSKLNGKISSREQELKLTKKKKMKTPIINDIALLKSIKMMVEESAYINEATAYSGSSRATIMRYLKSDKVKDIKENTL